MDLLLPIIIIVLNICFAISIIFFERKTPEIALAWLTVLVFLPVLGFLVYLAFGRNFYRTSLFKLKEDEDKKLESLVTAQIKDITRIDEESNDENKDRFLRVIRMLLTSNNALVTQNNTVETFLSDCSNSAQNSLVIRTQNTKEPQIFENSNISPSAFHIQNG